MRLLRDADVVGRDGDLVFRHSPGRALLVACATGAVSGGLIVFGWRERSWIAYYIAAVLLVGLFVLRWLVLARFRASNWLVRVSANGVFVQLRSYLNYHFPSEDLTVAFIPYPEIRSVRLIREWRDIPDRDDSPRRTPGVTRQTRASRSSSWRVIPPPSHVRWPTIPHGADHRRARPAPRLRTGTTRCGWRHPPRSSSNGMSFLGAKC
jgi:hypothetical protein